MSAQNHPSAPESRSEADETHPLILLIDDEAEIAGALLPGLRDAGYRVEWARTAQLGLELFSRGRPDLVLLDLMLTGGETDGLDVCRQIRSVSSVTIIVLSILSREEHKKAAFAAGASDYLTKSTQLEELLPRVRAGLLHWGAVTKSQDTPSMLEHVGLYVGPQRHTLICDGKVVELSPKQFQVVQFLAHHVGNVVTSDSLLRNVWGTDYVADALALRYYIRDIQAKIEPDPNRPCRLIAVGTIGYMLRLPQ